MRPYFLALLLLPFALAQAGPGIWAAGAASPWLVTPLWLLAMCGLLAASFALFGLRRLQPHAETLTVAATAASATLLHLAGAMLWSAVYLLIGVVLSVLTRWWARCSHPEIHTRTVTTTTELPVDTPTTVDRVGAVVAYGALLLTATLIVARPWHQSWGTTPDERDTSIAYVRGKEAPRYRVDRGVSIDAPAARVWPWIAQIGQDRAGFYSYDWMERAVGDEIHNADSLVPAWQVRQVGDVVRGAQPTYLGGRLGDSLGWRVAAWDPPHRMTLEGWGTFVVVPTGDRTSRLLVHEPGGGRPNLVALPTALLAFYLIEPAHFVMERRMLLGIKERAEAMQTSGS